MKTYLVFDASLQKEVPHTAELVKGEIVLTSTESGRFIKIDASLTPEQIKEVIAKHKVNNEGLVPIDEAKIAEEQKAQEDGMVDALSGLEIPE